MGTPAAFDRALAGESNESYGYATLGPLFAVGYITGLAAGTRPALRDGLARWLGHT